MIDFIYQPQDQRSQLRTWLHVSRGWPAYYLRLCFSKCMFNSQSTSDTPFLTHNSPHPSVLALNPYNPDEFQQILRG